MVFLRNCWYAAAWSHEVRDNILARTLLNEKVALFRAESGEIAATGNLCPHRFAPLHLGKIVNGAIECPYHGLRFDRTGRCVYNPDGDGRLPAGARLKTYPVTESHDAIWIWMGKAGKADLAAIPDFEFLRDPAYKDVRGRLHVKANYRYINDNIMDQAHLHMVHHNSLACDTIRRAKTQLEKRQDGSVWGNRYGENGAIPNIFDMMWRTYRGDYDPSEMDHWVEAGWYAPSCVRNNTGVGLHGRPRGEGIETKNAHLLTPETETTTHYFWSISRTFDADNTQLDEAIRKGTEYAFVHEDEVMLEAVQEAMGDREFWSMRPALAAADGPAVELRRALDRMIAAELETS
jgi:phenylpropionate dioxygenase-like ring-hydroxylating dioxygenase large terminal subunit